MLTCCTFGLNIKDRSLAVKQKSKTLSRSKNRLADTFIQLEVLNGREGQMPTFTTFGDLAGEIKPSGIDVFQINIGKLCNQSCAHCHVDAGPDKKAENMDKATLQRCLEIIIEQKIPTVDITGGAPEMNPHFRWFVEQCSAAGVKVMNRCNLTIIMSHPRFSDLPDFFARHGVHVVSSLPYFTKSRTDNQRGDGVFNDSIEALQLLNARGYGQPDSALELDLVYNPSGAFLPGDQQSLEQEFKRQLKRRYDIDFNRLYAITNLPIARFLDYLISSGNYAEYMSRLVDAFNPSTVPGLMCRNTLSVSWDGYIHDCDFNQMLGLKSAVARPHIDDFDAEAFMQRKIITNQHCYGCTAGAGSSCGGEVV